MTTEAEIRLQEDSQVTNVSPFVSAAKGSEAWGNWCQQVLVCMLNTKQMSRDKIFLSKCIEYQIRWISVQFSTEIPMYFSTLNSHTLSLRVTCIPSKFWKYQNFHIKICHQIVKCNVTEEIYTFNSIQILIEFNFHSDSVSLSLFFNHPTYLESSPREALKTKCGSFPKPFYIPLLVPQQLHTAVCQILGHISWDLLKSVVIF